MRAHCFVFFVVVAALAVLSSGCIEARYVPGGPCSSSSQCPALNDPENSDIELPQTIEQCVFIGGPSGGACVPMPFSRERTTCVDPSECQAAGFPVEVQCIEGTCRCDFPLSTACEPWDATMCACGLP